MSKESECGSASLAEKQSKYVKRVAEKRKVAKAILDEQKRIVEKYERRMDIAGNPHLFDKTTGHLAMQHEVSKGFVSYVRSSVKNA